MKLHTLVMSILLWVLPLSAIAIEVPENDPFFDYSYYWDALYNGVVERCLSSANEDWLTASPYSYSTHPPTVTWTDTWEWVAAEGDYVELSESANNETKLEFWKAGYFHPAIYGVLALPNAEQSRYVVQPFSGVIYYYAQSQPVIAGSRRMYSSFPPFYANDKITYEYGRFLNDDGLTEIATLDFPRIDQGESLAIWQDLDRAIYQLLDSDSFIVFEDGYTIDDVMTYGETIDATSIDISDQTGNEVWKYLDRETAFEMAGIDNDYDRFTRSPMNVGTNDRIMAWLSYKLIYTSTDAEGVRTYYCGWVGNLEHEWIWSDYALSLADDQLINPPLDVNLSFWQNAYLAQDNIDLYPAVYVSNSDYDENITVSVRGYVCTDDGEIGSATTESLTLNKSDGLVALDNRIFVLEGSYTDFHVVGDPLTGLNQDDYETLRDSGKFGTQIYLIWRPPQDTQIIGSKSPFLRASDFNERYAVLEIMQYSHIRFQEMKIRARNKTPADGYREGDSSGDSTWADAKNNSITDWSGSGQQWDDIGQEIFTMENWTRGGHSVDGGNDSYSAKLVSKEVGLVWDGTFCTSVNHSVSFWINPQKPYAGSGWEEPSATVTFDNNGYDIGSSVDDWYCNKVIEDIETGQGLLFDSPKTNWVWVVDPLGDADSQPTWVSTPDEEKRVRGFRLIGANSCGFIKWNFEYVNP